RASRAGPAGRAGTGGGARRGGPGLGRGPGAWRSALMAGGVVLYDFLATRGGAERVMLELAQVLQAQALCYGYRNPRLYPLPELEGLRCHDLRVPWRTPGLRDAAALRAFAGRGARCVAGYDWAVFSGSLAPLAVHGRPGRRNLYY